MLRANHLLRTISNATDSEIVPLNEHRVALIFSAPSANAYELNFTGTAALGAGIRIPAGSTPFAMTFRDYGEAVRGSVRAIADTAPVTVGITEIIGP